MSLLAFFNEVSSFVELHEKSAIAKLTVRSKDLDFIRYLLLRRINIEHGLSKNAQVQESISKRLPKTNC